MAERTLARGEMLELPDGDARVSCVEGELWLTRERDVEDHILGPGSDFLVRRGDRILVQALRASRLRVETREPATGTEIRRPAPAAA